MAEDRIRQFKNFGKDSQELRRRRNDAAVELRKSRKDEQLAKRRNIDMDEMKELSKDCVRTSPTSLMENNAQISFITLGKIHGDIFSGDAKQEFIACQTARKILSRERNPPIDSIIQSGIVPKCIQLLKSPNFDTQFEAAWIVTNIASGSSVQTNYIIQQGAVDPLIELLRSKHPHLVEQAVWALGNIAGDGPRLRDMLINKGIVPPLISLSKSQGSPTFLRNIAWTISNLCRGKQPSPPVEATRQLLTALGRLISLDDVEIISDACWALSYLTDGPNEKIEEVLKANVLSRIAQLLNSTEYTIITPCLRTIGNIVTGNDMQTDSVLAAGPVLQTLGRLLQSPKPNISKEAAWAISNITAGTISQINAVIKGGLVPILINVIHNGDLRARKEAVWALTNITSGGTVEHIVYLCQNGVIPAFCALFKCKESRSIMVAMDGLENILKGAANVGELDKIQEALEECGGLDALEQLQHHENETIFSKAYCFIEKYFNEDVDPHVADMLPAISENTGNFELNVPPPPKAGFDI